MRVQEIFGVLVVALFAGDASAQLQAARPSAGKAGVTIAASSTPGAFLGSDDCSSPHTPVGSGDVFGVPFVNGSTGTEGQNEANCYAFGTTAIDNDVWYDWTATTTGVGAVSTCAGTSVDTKLAVYPLSACPADGTSLACNDDACGFQSTATFPIAAGTSYTIQMGTFPGASGGAGTFDVTQGGAPPCGLYDDGTTENALGLTAGGETGWLHYQDCLNSVDSIETAYGMTGGASPPNGNSSRIVCYEDSDCDGNPTTPAGGMSVVWSVATITVNAGTNVLNSVPAPMGTNTYIASNCAWVMATADQAAGEFPAPMDQTNPTPNAWVVGNTPSAGSMDVLNLNNNNVPPLQTDAIGFPTAWLLRANSRDCMLACQQCVGMPANSVPCLICNTYPCNLSPVPQSCFGDTGCPCGNDGDGLGGCDNSLGTGGAILSGSGVPSLSNDTLVLAASRTPNQPGIFFQGDDALINPPTFGDGIRCCGNNVVRIGTYQPAGNMTDTATGNLVGGIGPPISQHPGNAGLTAGDSRCYQWWYRDPAGPCGGSFNLSNAVTAVWVP